ncbi:hypothetical protein F5B20DRAFT_580423 [Whalleya microplaca]|nr:hypothetical protein F5B20DRAFT_580423 [Whalleya microplaca]
MAARTANDLVFGVTARNLTEAHVMNWTRCHNMRIVEHLQHHWNEPTTDMDFLLGQLGLGGFEYVVTDQGQSVKTIITTKVRAKLLQVRNQIQAADPDRIGLEEDFLDPILPSPFKPEEWTETLHFLEYGAVHSSIRSLLTIEQGTRDLTEDVAGIPSVHVRNAAQVTTEAVTKLDQELRRFVDNHIFRDDEGDW